MPITFRNITVPNGSGTANWNPETRKRFIQNVSTYLDAGENIRFIDGNGAAAEVERIHLSSDGSVKSATIGGTAQSYAFLAKGWHAHRAHKIYHVGTTAGIALKVGMKQ